METIGVARLSRLTAAVLVLGVSGCGTGSPSGSLAPAGDDSGIVAQGGVLTRDQIDRIHATRMEHLLEGRFSGLQVLRQGGDYVLRIRGAGDPLLVVDGVPASNSRQLFTMNPRDIDQIEILKDAATSAYGLRGANGVVIVTTRTR